MLGVTKSAVEITAAEAHEDRRRSGMEAFALKGIEDFVNPKHGQVGRLVEKLRSVIFNV